MKLLKIRKRKTYSSVCNGLYDYKKQETFYIVELNEKEYIKIYTSNTLNNNEEKEYNYDK